MLFYRAALPLSSRTLTYVAGIIRRRRAAIGSAWRKLNSGKQGLLVPLYLRKDETLAHLAAAPLARRPTRQGHPRIAYPRGTSRMKKAHPLSCKNEWLTMTLAIGFCGESNATRLEPLKS